MIVFIGCEKDIYGDKYQNKILIKKTTFSDFENIAQIKNHQNVLNEIKFLQEGTLKNHKLVFNAKSQKYFDDENGILIEIDNLKYFTFPITADALIFFI